MLDRNLSCPGCAFWCQAGLCIRAPVWNNWWKHSPFPCLLLQSVSWLTCFPYSCPIIQFRQLTAVSSLPFFTKPMWGLLFLFSLCGRADPLQICPCPWTGWHCKRASRVVRSCRCWFGTRSCTVRNCIFWFRRFRPCSAGNACAKRVSSGKRLLTDFAANIPEGRQVEGFFWQEEKQISETK